MIERMFHGGRSEEVDDGKDLLSVKEICLYEINESIENLKCFD